VCFGRGILSSDCCCSPFRSTAFEVFLTFYRRCLGNLLRGVTEIEAKDAKKEIPSYNKMFCSSIRQQNSLRNSFKFMRIDRVTDFQTDTCSYFIKHHTMKTYGEWRYSATILNLCLRRRCVVRITLLLHHLQVNTPHYPLYKMLIGSQIRSGEKYCGMWVRC
jgi:hypothetical protein